MRRTAFLTTALLLAAATVGCHRDMTDQARYEAYEASDFFADGRAMRPPVEGTIARGQLNEDETFQTGKRDGQLVVEPPLPVDRALVERGRQRFNIYCSVCHGLVGEGDGMIVQRGFRRPPTYHSDRLRAMPIGHFFDVATHGFGAMPSYANQIPARDRWAIAVYVRALQLSQHASRSAEPRRTADPATNRSRERIAGNAGSASARRTYFPTPSPERLARRAD